MTIDEILPIILYTLLSILIIVLIIFIIRLFKTLKKVDKTIDDLNIKLNKVNGVFDIVNKSTDAISIISDKIVNGTMTLVSKIFKNKKREDDFDE